MKKIILIALFTISLQNCKAQNNFINLNELTINDFDVIGINQNSIIQNFGQPTNIENYFFEIENTDGERYNYQGVLFSLINNEVISFRITGNNYAFTSNNTNIGNNISSLQGLYPISYENKGSDYLVLNVVNCDCFISIYYNQNSGVIEEIRFVEP